MTNGGSSNLNLKSLIGCTDRLGVSGVCSDLSTELIMAEGFRPEDFLGMVRRLSDWYKLKKDELRLVADHLEVQFLPDMKKGEMVEVLVQHAGEIGEPLDNATRLQLSKLEVERERFRNINCQEERRAQVEIEGKRAKEETEREKIRLTLEQENTKAREETERELARIALEKEKLRIELELRKLEHDYRTDSNFDVRRNICLVPKFCEQEVDTFFLSFEKVAKSLKWPVTFWSLLAQSALTGRAQEVFAALDEEQSADYLAFKTAVLAAYELVPESYRQRFRGLQRTEGESHLEFARLKEMAFDR